LKVKYVADQDSLDTMQQVYLSRDWRIVKIDGRVEAYDKKTGKLKGIAEIKKRRGEKP